jgi:periplasmic protein TonB
MAYVDSNARRASPASIASAVAINALLVGGVILAAPELVKEPPWKIIELLPIAAPPPLPVPAAETDTKAQAPKPQVFTPKPTTRPAEGDNDLAPPAGGSNSGFTQGLGGGGGIIEQPQQPPPHIPVLSGAKVNPRYAGLLQPAYPPGMIREGREGIVVVRVLIGTDGRVRALEPVSSDGPAFLEVTRKQALSKWRFLPATRDGEPIEAWREMTVRFRLPD